MYSSVNNIYIYIYTPLSLSIYISIYIYAQKRAACSFSRALGPCGAGLLLQKQTIDYSISHNTRIDDSIKNSISNSVSNSIRTLWRWSSSSGADLDNFASRDFRKYDTHVNYMFLYCCNL